MIAYKNKFISYYNMPYGDEDEVPSTPIYKSTPIYETEYIATDGKFTYCLKNKRYSYEFACKNVTEPKIKLSNFEGCPHWYGLIYMPNGDYYELQCKINKTYLEEAHSMRGDWSGYKEGDYTGRFLNKAQIMTAFNLLKEIVKCEY